tara:strand:- start:218 stop:880 length:663 start_codon:yes stop_codon:yes gene_type:complete
MDIPVLFNPKSIPKHLPICAFIQLNYYNFIDKITIKLDNEISKASEILSKDGTILYATDTIWGIGCDATSDNAVLKVYKMKKRDLKKPLICLASSYEMISNYLEFMPNFDYHKLYKERPTTFIFDSPKGISSYITKYSKSIGFRVPNNDFCKKLISEFGKPIVSTSANLSEDKVPLKFKEINLAIKESVDYIVEHEEEKSYSLPSRVIKLGNDGNFEKIR